jgi:hypothetical protein
MEHNPFNNPNSTPTTTEEFAIMIKRGFESQTRFLDEHLTKLDARLDSLNARAGRIEADLHGLRSELVDRHEFENALDPLTYLEKGSALKAASDAPFSLGSFHRCTIPSVVSLMVSTTALRRSLG